MTKNYFTDAQVKELALQICEVTNKQTHDGSPIYEFTENRLKALMNLAVEAAIGEAYLNVDHSMTQNVRWIKVNNLKDKTPLYSVKELEN